MDNKDSKLQEQITKLEKLVTTLVRRVHTVEAENKRLKSAIIRADARIGQISQDLQRRGRS